MEIFIFEQALSYAFRGCELKLEISFWFQPAKKQKFRTIGISDSSVEINIKIYY